MELKQRDLPEKTIHVWYCNFDLNRDKVEYYSSLLSEDEKQKASRFKFKKDEVCYIISRGILRLLIGSYLRINPKDLNFKYTSFGKPFLTFENQLKFNVSHSGKMATFAFFQGTEIGVDIERIKDDFDVLELAQNFFSQKEIIALENQSKEELSKAFFRCWTRKEAFIKAEGSGLSFPLDKFAVSLDDDQNADLLETQWNRIEKDIWQLYSFIPAKGYLGAVAIAHSNAQISYHNWDTL
jgi:4'-phosphopantetheinyl transferase